MCIDSLNLPKVVSEICSSLLKIVENIEIFLIYKKGKVFKREGESNAPNDTRSHPTDMHQFTQKNGLTFFKLQRSDIKVQN